MEVIVTKTFKKQYLRCPNHVKEAVQIVIDELEKANSLREIKDLKKLNGFKNLYRIRAGQYRIGLEEQEPGIFLLCVMERRYTKYFRLNKLKYFPVIYER